MDPVKLRRFKEGWHRRKRDEVNAENKRFETSLSVAHRIGDRLRTQWGADEVFLFGSVAKRVQAHGRIRVDSDIDLAVSGIDPGMYFSVLADIEKLSPTPVDLILLEVCSTELYNAIERDGIPL